MDEMFGFVLFAVVLAFFLIVLPIREKYLQLMKDQDLIQDVLDAGAKKARAEAEKTMHELYKIIGV